MKPIKLAPKYAKPKAVVKSGFRRVTKSELKALGYSTKSALYTKAGVEHPTKFLTRSQIRAVQKPLREKQFVSSERLHKVSRYKREQIKGGIPKGKKRFKYSYVVYAGDYITVERAIDYTYNFFEFLKETHHPHKNSQIGMKYEGKDASGVDDAFHLMPRLWSQRIARIIEELKIWIKKYRKGFMINAILGYIEQSS